MLARRTFLRGLIAAPAIVAAGHIMPVRMLAPLINVVPDAIGGSLRIGDSIILDMINREAIRLFVNSNMFLRSIEQRYDADCSRIGSTLRIRLPADYMVRVG